MCKGLTQKQGTNYNKRLKPNNKWGKKKTNEYDKNKPIDYIRPKK
jgi:hypothetical protein